MILFPLISLMMVYIVCKITCTKFYDLFFNLSVSLDHFNFNSKMAIISVRKKNKKKQKKNTLTAKEDTNLKTNLALPDFQILLFCSGFRVDTLPLQLC